VFIKINTALPSPAAIERVFLIGKGILKPKKVGIKDAHFEMLLFLKQTTKTSRCLQWRSKEVEVKWGHAPNAQALGVNQHIFRKHLKRIFKKIFRPKYAENAYFLKKKHKKSPQHCGSAL